MGKNAGDTSCLSERHSSLLGAMVRQWDRGNYIISAETLGASLGYRPARKGILPVTSSLRALEKKGLVCRHPPEDQWCVAKWGITQKGRASLTPL